VRNRFYSRFSKYKSLGDFIQHLRLQRRFLISYLIVLIAPLTAAMLLYPSAARIVERKELEVRTLLVQDAMTTMDQSMRNIDNTLVDISRDVVLNRLLRQSKPGYGSSRAALVYDVHIALSSKLSYAKLPADIIIYMTKPDLALDGASVIYGRERYYDLAVSYDGMDYTAFEESILSQYHYRRAAGPWTIVKKKSSTNQSHATREEGFLYLQTLPVVGGLKDNMGTAIVHIGDTMLQTLSRAAGDDAGPVFIADAELNILTDADGMYTMERLESLSLTETSGSLHDIVDGERVLITYTRSGYNGWYYISVSPLSEILKSLANLRVILTTSLAGILALGVTLSLYLSRSSARPYEEALSRLASATRGGATPGDLNDAVSGLLSDQEEMRKSLERARLASRENFLEELLRGELNDDGAILEKASSLGINLQGSSYSVAVLTLPSEPGCLPPDIMIMIGEYVSRSIRSARAYAHTLTRQRLGIVLCFNETSEIRSRDTAADITDIIKGFERQASSELAGGIRCYVGGLVTRPSFLCISYSEAEAAMMTDAAAPGGRASDNARPLTHYREVARKGRGFVYPNEIETKMMLLCTGGDKARLHETLDYLYEENFVKRSLDRQMAYALFADMYATLIQVAGTLNLSWMPQSFFSMRMATLSVSVEFERVRACYDRLADLYAERRSSESADEGMAVSDAAWEMEQYIREHFARSDMSVAVMANRFNVSETYFSEYFKRSIGQTFSAFLETTRINNACQLLKQTDRSVEEIASDTGYTNALSFRRAFKKVTGVSPRDYRRGACAV
jgi:AraC-like DNA-binding protein